ncbi:MaoC family dehydratase [Pusillimonas sp. SM2304]|uniref:MaoC family dehydratase n=1 Tax=Pusillimonas sp. SM2304 TaxID=3073241 RepID=UPI002875B653|nr:MaoC family dehydratase [Pusillimonas sp. SM2304]MDS1139584.1 MaoC family dehydratase [Pusillimonas sp. SM2304]
MSTKSSIQAASEAVFVRWAPEGFKYPVRPIVHSAQWQAERLSASDVSHHVHGDVAEAGLFGLDCFDSMVQAGLNIDGYIFFDQTFTVSRLPALGEQLTIEGEVCGVLPVKRGLFVDETFTVRDAHARVCLTTRLRGIVDVSTASLPEVHRMPVRDSAPEDGWRQVASKTLTPDHVRRFSEDVGNDLHFDPAAAARYGFDAPLAQGVMSAVYLLSPLAMGRMPARFDVTIDFLRPIYWHSPVTLWARDTAQSDSISMVQTRDEADKVTAHLSVRSLSYINKKLSP